MNAFFPLSINKMLIQCRVETTCVLHHTRAQRSSSSPGTLRPSQPNECNTSNPCTVFWVGPGVLLACWATPLQSACFNVREQHLQRPNGSIRRSRRNHIIRKDSCLPTRLFFLFPTNARLDGQTPTRPQTDLRGKRADSLCARPIKRWLWSDRPWSEACRPNYVRKRSPVDVTYSILTT